MRLRDRTAVVTGAQQGIGEAIALAYARAGARVVVNYLDDAAAAEAIVARIAAEGGQASPVQGDVALAGDVARIVAASESTVSPYSRVPSVSTTWTSSSVLVSKTYKSRSGTPGCLTMSNTALVNPGLTKEYHLRR